MHNAYLDTAYTILGRLARANLTRPSSLGTFARHQGPGAPRELM